MGRGGIGVGLGLGHGLGLGLGFEDGIRHNNAAALAATEKEHMVTPPTHTFPARMHSIAQAAPPRRLAQTAGKLRPPPPQQPPPPPGRTRPWFSARTCR